MVTATKQVVAEEVSLVSTAQEFLECQDLSEALLAAAEQVPV